MAVSPSDFIDWKQNFILRNLCTEKSLYHNHKYAEQRKVVCRICIWNKICMISISIWVQLMELGILPWPVWDHLINDFWTSNWNDVLNISNEPVRDRQVLKSSLKVNVRENGLQEMYVRWQGCILKRAPFIEKLWYCYFKRNFIWWAKKNSRYRF